MTRVILGQFPASTLPPLRSPSRSRRTDLSVLVDDLTVIAANCPKALAVLAALARRYAAPIRLRLRRPDAVASDRQQQHTSSE